MKRILVSALALGLLALTACTAPSSPVAALPGPVPEGVVYRNLAPEQYPAAPDADVVLLDGTTTALSDLWDDRPVLVFFTEAWCELCENQQEGLDSVVDIYGDAVPVVAVAERSDPEELGTYARENEVEHLLARDPSGAAWKSYAVTEPPFLAMIGPGGTLLRGWSGVIDDLPGAVDALLVEEMPGRG